MSGYFSLQCSSEVCSSCLTNANFSVPKPVARAAQVLCWLPPPLTYKTRTIFKIIKSPRPTAQETISYFLSSGRSCTFPPPSIYYPPVTAGKISCEVLAIYSSSAPYSSSWAADPPQEPCFALMPHGNDLLCQAGMRAQAGKAMAWFLLALFLVQQVTESLPASTLLAALQLALRVMACNLKVQGDEKNISIKLVKEISSSQSCKLPVTVPGPHYTCSLICKIAFVYKANTSQSFVFNTKENTHQLL